MNNVTRKKRMKELDKHFDCEMYQEMCPAPQYIKDQISHHASDDGECDFLNCPDEVRIPSDCIYEDEWHKLKLEQWFIDNGISEEFLDKIIMTYEEIFKRNWIEGIKED